MYMALNGIVFVKHLLTHSVSFRILYSGLCDTWTQFTLVDSECVDYKSSQFKLPLIKTSDNHTSITC